jgi:thiamine biosynthesis lipoprotein
VILVNCEEDRALDLLTWLQGRVHDWESLLSRFRPDSGLSRINAAAGSAPVSPDPALWDLLLACRDYWKRTEGAFDIALLPLHDLWKRCRAEGRSPAPEELAEARSLSGFGQLDFDLREKQVRLSRRGAGLDLGGLGKGFIADQLARDLREAGQPSALLSLGESTVYGLGLHPSGQPWPLALAPLPGLAPEACSFPLANCGFSCSGTPDWPRAAFASLALDPLSSRPLDGRRCLAISTASATDAEVLSSALLALPHEARLRVCRAFPPLRAAEICWQGDPSVPAQPTWSLFPHAP